MIKYPVILLILLSFAAISGCTSDRAAPRGDLAGSTYTGVIPCADCEGIAYKLILKKNHRFETASVYIGKSNKAFKERGRWTTEGDSLITLNASEENARKFKITNNQLMMLDRQGKQITGSLAKMYVLGKTDSSATDYRWEARRNRGIDFHAAGNEPSWSLDMDFDKKLTFKTLKGDSLYASVPKMQQDSTGNARLWKVQTPAGSLKVELYPTGCVDEMSGEVFKYRVRVVRGHSWFNGCGSFINKTYKLNDFWTLYRLNGKKISMSDKGRTKPSLQFHIADRTVYGNAGCNRLNGTITLKDSSLTFEKIATTKMACRKSMQIESTFLKALQKVDRYDIANAELLLMGHQDTLLVFRRAQ